MTPFKSPFRVKCFTGVSWSTLPAINPPYVVPFFFYVDLLEPSFPFEKVFFVF